VIKSLLVARHFESVKDYFEFMGNHANNWLESEQAQWIFEHTQDPVFHLVPDGDRPGYCFQVYASASPKDLINYFLRY